jgi:hypothetical protein
MGDVKDRYERLYGLDGEKYRDGVCRKYGSNEINGRFDWWLSENPDAQLVYPLLARVQSIGGEDAEHTPSAGWHRENEFNEIWAGQVEVENGKWHPDVSSGIPDRDGASTANV